MFCWQSMLFSFHFCTLFAAQPSVRASCAGDLLRRLRTLRAERIHSVGLFISNLLKSNMQMQHEEIAAIFLSVSIMLSLSLGVSAARCRSCCRWHITYHLARNAFSISLRLAIRLPTLSLSLCRFSSSLLRNRDRNFADYVSFRINSFPSAPAHFRTRQIFRFLFISLSAPFITARRRGIGKSSK